MVKMTLSPAYAVEGTNQYTDLVFTATLVRAVDYNVTVYYRTIFDGSAVVTDLYRDYDGSFTILAGSTSATITLDTSYYDDVNERDETFTLELFNPTSGVTFQHNQPILRSPGIIQDDDGDPNLSFVVTDPIIEEGNSGERFAVFEVWLSRPASKDLTFDYTTVDGSALAGSDYVKTAGTLDFKTGQEVAYVRVAIKGDKLLEGSEDFSLQVVPPKGEGFSKTDSVGVARILDDDASNGPVVSIQDAYAIEGTNKYTPLRFTLVLSEAAEEDLSVYYRTNTSGTALDSDLYRASTGQVTFRAGQTSAEIELSTSYYDDVSEDDEVFFVELYNPSAGLELAGGVPVLSAAGYILDDDGTGSKAALAAAPVSIAENAADDSKTVSSVSIKLSRPLDAAQVFSVKAVNGTAFEGRDFKLLQDTVRFAPGQTEAGVKVKILGDFRQEKLETFELAFKHKFGADFSGSILNQTVSIVDTVAFTAGAESLRLTNFDDNVKTLGGGDEIFGLKGNDRIDGGSGRDILDGGAGNDILIGGGEADSLFGGKGNDILRGGKGGDKLYGDGGNDTADYTGASGPVRASLSKPGTNRGEASGDSYRGIENLTGSSNDDFLTGNGGNNVIKGGNGGDSISGAGGRDWLYGQKGHDKLFGGKGNDVLAGAEGNDRMTGNGGADTFIFDGGKDVILDFQDGVDTVRLDSDLWTGSYSVQRVIDRYGFDYGKEVALEFSGGNSLTFKGVAKLDTLVDNIEIV
ncbi:Calx-beta domain-containing protein [Tropicimonas sediminicola]|uniref:Hemolysin-type calcium-binding repeat-containing protein n=1 Tax=Tropicimonas sediminicola TaxID=1031541 RepID=A0A239GTH7_9RHOB|nr:Calx-beta domain-containing protein [Tropicimonas sediminicola]SNS72519.1 Hemolysin-type calcium-binding repeat-containing protein [Tropicimonas sediminicola]